MSDIDADIEAFRAIQEETKPGEERLDALRRLAKELVKLSQDIETMEEVIKPKAARLHFLKTRVIPDMMSSLEMEDFTFRDGSKIKLEDYISGSLPKDPERRAEALALIEAYGGGSIIKNVISVEFEKKQHNEAMALAADLKERGFNAQTLSDVNHQTLKAFIRERYRNGEAIEVEKLGCSMARTAKIEVSDATKAKLAANKRKNLS